MWPYSKTKTVSQGKPKGYGFPKQLSLRGFWDNSELKESNKLLLLFVDLTQLPFIAQSSTFYMHVDESKSY